MNRKQLLTLLVLVAVVGGATLLVYKKQNENRRAGNVTLGQKLLANFPVNDIARITISQGADEVNLEKKNDLWTVRERGGYPASFDEIKGFLIKASEIKAMGNEKVGESQLKRLSLAPGNGTNSPVIVAFRGPNDKEMQTLFFGKKQFEKPNRPSPMGEMEGGWANGRWVKVGEKSDNVVLISEPFENIQPKPESWLNKEFLKVEKPKSVSVEFQIPTNSWKLVRETESGQWKLADSKAGEELDQSKASSMNYILSSASFNDVIVGGKPEELGLDKPSTIKIETFNDFVYTIKVGQKTNENYAMTVAVDAQLPRERTPGKDEKPEEKAKLDKEFQDSQKKLQEKLAKEKTVEGWVYQVAGWALESALKERHQLLAEKKEQKSEQPDGVSSNSPSVDAGAGIFPGSP